MWIFLAIVLIAILFQYLSLKHALEDLHYSYEPSSLLSAPEEVFDMVTTLHNNSRRFVPYVRLIESMPNSASVYLDGAVIEDYKFMNETWHISKLFLMPKSTVVRKFPISFPTRGRYTFSGCDLKVGDFLGLKEESTRIDSRCEVVVYPKAADFNYVITQLGGFFGDMSVRRFIIEDPILTAGFAEYTGREPMKAISWPQSAKSGRMMVKTFDYTTELSVSLVLNIEGDDDEIEKSLSLTHTVCRILEKKRIKYNFYSNLIPSGAKNAWTYIAEGLGSRHFQLILEGLGRATYKQTEPLEKLIARVPKERGIILVSCGKVEEV